MYNYFADFFLQKISNNSKKSKYFSHHVHLFFLALCVSLFC